MSFREKIVNWISGGEMGMLRAFAKEDSLYWMELASKRREALKDILAQETPYANATVRRMVKIAKEVLYD
jgi:hypothetical protein